MNRKIFLLGLLLVFSLAMAWSASAIFVGVAPANNTWSTTPINSVNFTYNNTDFVTANCSVLLNSTGNFVIINTSYDIANNTQVNARNSSISVPGGVHTWYVSCNNITNMFNTTLSNFGFDPSASNITITSPGNLSFINFVPISVNGTANDNVSGVTGSGVNVSASFIQINNNTGACWLGFGVNIWNASCQASPVPGGNDWLPISILTADIWNNTLTSIPLISGIRYNISVRTVDTPSVGYGLPNVGLAVFLFTFDNTTPVSAVNSINSKTNSGNSTTSRDLTINFTSSDSFILNWSLQVYNSSWSLLKNWTDTASNTSVALVYNATADGVYYVNITTTDNATNSNTTSFTITADATAPSVAINDVNNQSSGGWSPTRNLLINFTANDTLALNWSLVVYNSTLGLLTNWSDTVSNNSVALNYTVSADGTYYVNLTAINNASTVNSTQLTILVDATNPAAAINSVNTNTTGQWSQNQTLVINFNASDSNIFNWSLRVYNSTGALLKNWSDTVTNNSANLSYSTSADDTYDVNLTVRDNATNSNETTFKLYVDSLNPAATVHNVNNQSSGGL
ncbi:MAG: hypothetical protein AABY26_06995, partial [Nanoarchaeota archaeon]